MSKICEGQSVPHTHSETVYEYIYLNDDVVEFGAFNLCDRCVKLDRANGDVMERTFVEELP